MSLTRLLDAARGPAEIVLVRHGESVGNLADAEARRRGAERLELSARDADVELSPTGRDQADALARWLEGLAAEERPTVVATSPYRRAAETAQRALRATGLEVAVDERLRERDLGLFDGLTSDGIRALFPEEAARRQRLGKFYYQPPSGESWADVVLRVRQLLTDLREGFADGRVWLFTHQAVIMAFRYALEGLDEQALLDVDRTHRLANASITRFRRGPSGYALEVFGDTVAVDAAPAAVTHEEPGAGRGAPDSGEGTSGERAGGRDHPDAAGDRT